ncbi:MAG: SDR family NAD(P)-dependent oxidoreductase [Kineosporiaceae bacterium]|nr:SDR family NAD(P)-dependent oxidoreductase [Aeromicrobium sp.]
MPYQPLSHTYFHAFTSADEAVLVNVASLLGHQPTPYLATHGASKAFVLSFTESLWEEARGTGLHVLAVCPGAMETVFFDALGRQAADKSVKRATAQHAVGTALKTMGRRSAPPSVVTNGRPLDQNVEGSRVG